VGQGTFYRNFTDKRDIFETLFDEFQTDLVSEFSDMSTNLPNSLQEYRQSSAQASRRMATKIVKKRDLALVFAREAPTIDHRFSEKWNELQERFSQLARFFLEHAASHGFARPCNTDLVSRAIIGSAMYMSQLYLAGNIEHSPDKIIDELVDFAFNGIGLRE
ncbi:hypothetical protein KDL45_16955, partial [bacterium]|nr:hypothetical protein [bacterium]